MSVNLYIYKSCLLSRARSISTPKKRDGEDCEGDKFETKSCNTDGCPMCRDDDNNVYEPYQTVNETDCDVWFVTRLSQLILI